MSHGPVMLDLLGTALSPEEQELLMHPATGGVILFSRNYQGTDQLAELTKEIHRLRRPELLITVDQEGGRVQRFREGFVRLPPAAWFGRLYASDRNSARDAARDIGWLMAAELLAHGVDFSFAPVLDLGGPISEVIGDRAFAESPDAIIDLARSWSHGARQAGMASVGKHFPGHGRVVSDSHLELPVDGRSLGEILEQDIRPFRALISDGLEAIMPAHVLYPHVDPSPAGFSRFWLNEILRGRLGYQGVIFSDDLNMSAADSGGSYAQRASAALDAGCDMILICNNRPAAIEVLESLEDYQNPISQTRLLRMHGKNRQDPLRLKQSRHWHTALKTIEHFQAQSSLSLDF